MTVDLVPIQGSLDSLKSQVKGSKLVIPSISIGNVPQLSADLFIHNLQTKLVAQLDSTYLYPFASPVDYVDNGKQVDHDVGVSTALELYYNEELNLSIIQQRSPILSDYSQNFLDYLVSVVTELEFNEVLLLDSNDHALKTDLNYSDPIELYSNDLNERFKSLNVSNTSNLDKAKELFTPFVSNLIHNLNNTTTITALLIYVYEGDNFYDAELFTKKALDVLNISIPSNFQKPKSWGGVYGDRPIPTGYEEGLFG
ncbi:Proteasome assembly chaperone 2 [Wickerhamomyces ciferrii]|uniref:Proteasome assembly chaperone 2 n=1 Tax=Wickerhamomyces ciferrii (strain ATCC 14091 / BCRC 22168 / CBS 111 / JCM 3599 / NBRC 0793 / NRRL Y-1031 F-60-10) TaxID=1206466 RepID=K0K850_WICCF|nr:Proteasome assembly chaperone 2 [Wickerhamomyces ciferrii]CCH41000.1 Proteasome assembly chaperone 2 [Wickerhamomyces ciferrii]